MPLVRQHAPRAHPLLRAAGGVCAAGHATEAEAGAAMLARGGNAIDAVVAAAFAGCVVEQVDCSLAGFARIAVWLEERGEFLTFDGYVRAPGQARPDMFEVAGAEHSYYGHPVTRGDAAKYGPLAVAVPGAVAGLCAAHEAGGALPLAEVLAPAISQADRGVPFAWRDVLAIAALHPRLADAPDAAAVLLPGGTLPRIPLQTPGGDRIDTRALARTLRAIAERGAQGFYEGEVARAIADHVRDRGGILSAGDLAAYRPRVLREDLCDYRGYRYVAGFDHVAYEALNILGGYDLAGLGPDSAKHRHLMAEALGIAFTDCIAHYGDPDVVPSPVRGLASPGYAARRREDMSLQRAVPRPIEPGDPWPFDDGRGPTWQGPSSLASRRGTSQMVAVDSRGNAAAVCTAVGWNFGSLEYVPEAGVFLNNAMSYFDPRPGRPASIAPGKMPIFGAPAVVARDGDGALFACAGSGGYRIESAVLHAMVHHIDHGMDVAAAIEEPRVHCQGNETYVDARIDARVSDELARMGHRVERVAEDAATLYFARVCAVSRDGAGGAVQASAAPHWITALVGA